MGAPIKFGSVIRLQHSQTRAFLYSLPELYRHPNSSNQQMVGAVLLPNEGCNWLVKPADGIMLDDKQGQTVKNGDTIRLEHVRTRTNLHSHSGHPAPKTKQQQEVTAYGSGGEGDANDNWKVVTSEGEPDWQSGSLIRLVHLRTQHALHSHQNDIILESGGWVQEVTGFKEGNRDDFWTAALCELIAPAAELTATLSKLVVTVETQNYRALRRTNWKPSGVCVLVGPNGAGKTTLLTLLEFLRSAYLDSAPTAMDRLGGAFGLRSWGAPDEEPTVVALTVGELRWELQLATQGPTLSEQLGERITRGDDVILSRAAFSQRLVYNGVERQIADHDERLALRIVVDTDRPTELGPLVRALASVRVFRSYNISELQANGSRQSGDLYLQPSGQNVFAVLRNWRDRRELQPQYDFVLNGLRSAFPDVFADIDFRVAGLTVTVDLLDPSSHQPFPLAVAPDGWITGLLHLTAVASTPGGSVVAIDDFGNDLHPYAIRTLTDAFREWAEEHKLIVCLASHSPVLLDEFKEQPDAVFVMDHGRQDRPVPLTDLFDPDWLSRFSLGRLYEHGEFGGQRKRIGPPPNEKPDPPTG